MGGCAEEEKAVPIWGAVVAISASELEVTLGCYDSVRVEVDEGPERVELRGYGKGEIGGDCANTETVSLDAPVGDRAVVDAKTGRIVDVMPADG